MLERSSLRHSTKPTIQEQSTADHAEQCRVDIIWGWRFRWLPIYIEIIAIANAAQARDLEGVFEHVGHLQLALAGLRVVEKTA